MTEYAGKKLVFKRIDRGVRRELARSKRPKKKTPAQLCREYLLSVRKG